MFYLAGFLLTLNYDARNHELKKKKNICIMLYLVGFLLTPNYDARNHELKKKKKKKKGIKFLKFCPTKLVVTISIALKIN